MSKIFKINLGEIQPHEINIINENENKKYLDSESCSSEDEKYYNFYGIERDNDFLDIISLIPYESESDSISSCDTFKKRHSIFWDIKNYNIFSILKNINNKINFTAISHMFSEYLSLISLPDISKSIMNRIISIKNELAEYLSLIPLPLKIVILNIIILKIARILKKTI